MLFNSTTFIFLFLPLTFAGFVVLRRYARPTPAILWLGAASYVFYGWYEPALALLLFFSTAVNFSVALGIAHFRRGRRESAVKLLMWLGVAFDLGLLGYYKYAGFIAASVAAVTGVPLPVPDIALPIGISFYTFTQIAFVVDAAHADTAPLRAPDYLLFVSYFPHLVAGPIIDHKATIPQFRKLTIDPLLVGIGLSIIAIGLFKKTIIADNVAPFANAVFDKAPGGVGIVDGWCGALAYTFQIYFDFSGYSDLAIGLSLLFGVRLPLNFASPYKSTSIVEFWTRWHMSLSGFLRDFLYIPLGGNRHGSPRRYVNLMITMLLGGLWHGAAWTFVAWGALHGLYLVINHLLRQLFPSRVPSRAGDARLEWAKRLGVFLIVVIAWVLFRAASIDDAFMMLKGMAGVNGLGSFAQAREAAAWIIACLAIVWFMPNSYEMFARFRPTLPVRAELTRAAPAWLAWLPSQPWAVIMACVLSAGILAVNQYSPFLYFRF